VRGVLLPFEVRHGVEPLTEVAVKSLEPRALDGEVHHRGRPGDSVGEPVDTGDPDRERDGPGDRLAGSRLDAVVSGVVGPETLADERMVAPLASPRSGEPAGQVSREPSHLGRNGNVQAVHGRTQDGQAEKRVVRAGTGSADTVEQPEGDQADHEQELQERLDFEFTAVHGRSSVQPAGSVRGRIGPDAGATTKAFDGCFQTP